MPVKLFRGRALFQGLTMMVVVAAAYPAHAAIKRSAVVVHISGREDATTDVVTDPRCVGQGYQLSGTPEDGTGAIYKGTLGGVSSFCAQVRSPYVQPDASGFDYHEEDTFVGTVKGCGTGTFDYILDGVLHPFDPSKQYFPADESWIIVKGTGTGDLAGIRSGLNHRTGGVNLDGSPFAVFDPARNSLTCIPTHRKK
jgi:hypothetical protein